MAAKASEGADDHLIALHVLDGFWLESTADGRLTIKNRKACALLAYLALSGHGTASREQLAGLLWSDRSEAQARASLRQCLKQLRTALQAVAPELLRAGRHEISLDSKALKLDLATVAEQLENGKIDGKLSAGEVIPERILYGFETLDQAFSAWLHVVRQSWQDRIVTAMQEILRDATRGDKVRLRAAEGLVHVDASHEEAQRYLIANFALEGNVAAALREYNELWDLLGDEYDMEPAEETQALIADIKAGTFQAPALPAAETPGEHAVTTAEVAPAVRDAPTIAIPTGLPVLEVGAFNAGRPSQAEGYLIEGFRRDLVASIVRFREWIIVEATDRSGARPSHSVDYQLEGTYFDDADTVRLVVTLKDMHTGRFIWSERYLLNFETWFSAQQEIVRRMSVALNVYLSAERIAQQITEPDMPLESYDQWLRGQDLILHWAPEAEYQAEDIFRNIIAQTPSFAPAYSSLASIYNSRHVVFPGTLRSPELEEEALRYAKKAVELDPLDTRGQLALGWSNAMRGRFDQAALHYKLSYDLNANNPTTLVSCAHGLAFCGDYETARELCDLAIKINPSMPVFHWGYVAGIRFITGDYDGCIEAADIAKEVISILPGMKAASLALQGRLEEAKQAAGEFVSGIRANWYGSQACTEQAVVRWLLHSFPTKDPEVQERLREGLRLSGLPVND